MSKAKRKLRPLHRFLFVLIGLLSAGGCSDDPFTAPSSAGSSGAINLAFSTSPQEFAYVANSTDGTVSVIRVSDHTVVGTVSLFRTAHRLAITADGEFVYVTNGSSDTVSVIRTADNSVVETIAVEASGIDITPDGELAYVAGGSLVSVIRTEDNSVSATIPVSGFEIEISPDGEFAYVADFDNQVHVIQTTDNTVIESITVGSSPGPGNIAISPDGSLIYVTDGDDLSVIQTSDHTVIATVPLTGDPGDLAVAPDGSVVYVVWADESMSPADYGISVINATDHSVIGNIDLPIKGFAVAFSADGGIAYVTGGGVDAVTVINTTSRRILQTITVGGFPTDVAFTRTCSLEDLHELVDDLEADGALNKGQANALHRKLLQVEKLVDKGEKEEAALVMQGFLEQVEAFEIEGVLSSEEASDLIDCAGEILGASSG